MPANTLTVQTVFVEYATNRVEVRLAAGGTGQTPVGETG
jgi:hypothetical protein